MGHLRVTLIRPSGIHGVLCYMYIPPLCSPGRVATPLGFFIPGTVYASSSSSSHRGKSLSPICRNPSDRAADEMEESGRGKRIIVKEGEEE
jgi:hypothetical protein